MAPPTQSLSHSFFATCPRNTEGLLLDELRSLGAADAAETRAGVAFSGPLPLAYRACLWSRTASRVLLRMTSFPASSPDDLYEGIHRMAWEDHLDPQGTLAVEVTSTVRQGPLAQLNTHFAEQRIKDAVVDRFRARAGVRPGVDLARPDIRINLHLTPAEAIVSLDLSGDGLHRRGYRLEGGEAPLKENLASAILMRAGWPHVAESAGSLVDPMCGSGTLLVEGALMAGDIAPGLLREYFGFLGWRGFDPHPWGELVGEARERRELGLERLPLFYGYDSDARALGRARGNAQRAGLAGPLSKRLGEISDLVGVYETLGERLKESFSGWEAAVFTGNPELGAHLGLRAYRTNVFYNGPLPCRLLVFKIDPAGFQNAAARRRESELPHSGSEDTDDGTGDGVVEESRRLLPLSRSDTTPGATMFGNRLTKNLKHLRRWATREGVHCYRLYDADLPEYAVAVDLYEDWAHVQEYSPPRTVDPVLARRRLKEIVAVVPEVLGIPAEQVVLKVRQPQRGAEQYQKLRDEGDYLEVEEGGLRFLVNLTDYLDTGLFLDHRVTRGLLRELAPGRRFLNLFAYTGSATVYAAAGGAASTTTVDLSLTYLDWARRNLALNGFSGPEHGFVRADCLEWLAQMSAPRGPAGVASAANAAGSYDLIFLDAPTFSNSKSMTATLDIQRDHVELVRAAAGLLSPEGIMIFSSNFRRFKLDPAVALEFKVADITKQTIPPDFARDPRIHACFRIMPEAHPVRS
jgi:23S rRNA (guanine2445-N2)-methyltransferase / 23S rRNA (guanine2069-N7)-methyltransferase